MSSQVGAGFVAISPSFRGFRRAVVGESARAGQDGAKAASNAFSGVGERIGGRLGRGVKAAFGKSAAGLGGVELKRLQSEVAKASSSLSAARLKQQDAAGRVRVAEARLAEAIEKTGAGSARAIAAEESLAAARRKQQVATDAVTAASERLKTAQQAVARATDGVAAGASRVDFKRLAAGFKDGFTSARAARSSFTGLAGALGGLSRAVVKVSGLESLGKQAGKLVDRVSPAFESVSRSARSAFANISSGFTSRVVRPVGAAASRLGDGITAGLGRVRANESVSRIADAFQTVSGRITRHFEPLTSSIGNVFGKVSQSVNGALGSVGFSSFGSAARSAFAGVADAAGRAGAAIAKGIGDGIQAASKAAAVGMAAIGTQMVAAVKGSVAGFAEYEQAVGGVDTLFKDASGKVQKYAAEAFSTAGVSANDYMSQVTSFSASLIGSLGGDTEAAAELANQAMIDMSDNANKMGTDMASIQGTYQSLARGNYAMLDNLKLGYGGTKAEMERLLADAEKLSGKKYSGDNFADIVSAIHVVQEELGITGTTALEAEETISGSANAMKASWSNWLTELAKTGGDVDGVTKQLASSVGTWLGNIGPVIKQAVTSLVQSIPMLLSSLVESLPAPFQAAFDRVGGMFSGFEGQLGPLMAGFGALGTAGLTPLLSKLPVVGGLFDGLAKKLPFLTNPLFLAAAGLGAFAAAGGDFGAVADGVTGVVDSIVAALPGLIEKAVDVIPQFVESILAALPQLLDAGTQILDSLIEGIIVALPMLVEGAVRLLNGLITAIVQNLPKIIQAAVTLVSTLVRGLIQAMPLLLQGAITLITGLVQGIIDNLPMIIAATVQLIVTLTTAIMDNLPLLIDAAIQMLTALVQGLIDNLPLIIDAAIQLIVAVMTALLENLPLLIEAAVSMITAIVTGLIDNLPALVGAAVELVLALAGGLIKAIPDLVAKIPELTGAAIKAILDVDWIGVGVDIVGGMIEGIGSMAQAFWDGLVNMAKDAWQGIKDFFSIHSPSRLMRDSIGKQIVRGMIVGIEDETSNAVQASTNMAKRTHAAAVSALDTAVLNGETLSASLQHEVRATKPREGRAELSRTPVEANVNVYTQPGMSEKTVADLAKANLDLVLAGRS